MATELHCGRCHTCGAILIECSDGWQEWCCTCQVYRRYVSHGWARSAGEISPCPIERPAAHPCQKGFYP